MHIKFRDGRQLLRRLLRALAFNAQTKLSQSLPRINAVIVPVAEQEFHTVASYVFGAQDCKVLGDRSRIEYAQACHFADAVSAQALRSQVLDRIDAHVIVVPSNCDLACAGLLYFKWCRHSGRQ